MSGTKPMKIGRNSVSSPIVSPIANMMGAWGTASVRCPNAHNASKKATKNALDVSVIPLPYRVESTSFTVTGCQAFGSRCDSFDR
jgi:hypothetical protein